MYKLPRLVLSGIVYINYNIVSVYFVARHNIFESNFYHFYFKVKEEN